jgi:hypothetical protein
MRSLKVTLTVVAIGAGALASTNSAQARHYRPGYSEYVTSAASCTLIARSFQYIYPIADWEPFFRRHVYRYGPVPTCLPLIETTSVISVRY